MTADPHRVLPPPEGPQGFLVGRGVSASVDVPGGVVALEGARAVESHAWAARVPGVADRRDAGWSPFPLDAIEID